MSDSETISAFNAYFTSSTTIILTVLGLIGNLIVFLVYTSAKFRKVPMFRYYAVSVIFETLELLLIWIYNYPDFFQFHKNSISCQTIQYIAYLFGEFVSWIAVVITIDRLMSVKSATKFKFRKKLSVQFFSLLTIFLISSFIYSPFFIFNDVITHSDNTSFCGVEDAVTSLSMHISDFFISTLIPFLLMIIFSCITGYYLINNKRRLNVKKLKKEIRLFKILISMNFFFFFCYFPWSAYVITNDIYTIQNISPNYMSIVYNVTNFIIFLYCSCSFVVHLICNKKFRSVILYCKRKVVVAKANHSSGNFSSNFFTRSRRL